LTSSSRIAEIVPALARERIAFAEAGLEPLAHLDQQLVARRVAEPFGHRFEPVHVQEEDRQAIAFATPGARERAPRHGPGSARDWAAR